MCTHTVQQLSLPSITLLMDLTLFLDLKVFKTVIKYTNVKFTILIIFKYIVQECYVSIQNILNTLLSATDL